jgi:hypothetical protein
VACWADWLQAAGFALELLNFREKFGVECYLRSQPGHICGSLQIIRLQDFGLLACARQRRLQLLNLVLEWRWIDLKQHVAGFHQHVGFDLNGCDLTRHIRCHLHNPSRNGQPSRWRE